MPRVIIPRDVEPAMTFRDLYRDCAVQLGKADLLMPEAEETERNERGATPRSDEGR